MPLSVRCAMSCAISLSFLSTHVVVYCLRRSWCSTLRPLTVSCAAPSSYDGCIVVNVPLSIVVNRLP